MLLARFLRDVDGLKHERFVAGSQFVANVVSEIQVDFIGIKRDQICLRIVSSCIIQCFHTSHPITFTYYNYNVSRTLGVHHSSPGVGEVSM